MDLTLIIPGNTMKDRFGIKPELKINKFELFIKKSEIIYSIMCGGNEMQIGGGRNKNSKNKINGRMEKLEIF
ncbi:MAG: hypothetical protein V4547_09815 [Bacteroidota bacterium]